MPESSVRARAVDVLFGEALPDEGDLPTYVVEPPKPTATITPPTASPNTPPSPPPGAISPSPLKGGQKGDTTLQFMPPPPPPPTRTTLARSSQPAALDPLFGLGAAPAPRISPASAGSFSKDQSQYALYVSDMIRNLYEQVSVQLADSPTVSDFCMGVLLKAREAYQGGNYPLAEFYAESVDVKLKRSARSLRASSGLGIWLLWLWQFSMLGLGGFLIGATYIANLTLFGVLVSPELLIGMRIVGWGIIGGVISAVYNMPRFVQFREYDPAYAMNYFSRPLQGLLAGALIYLISQTFLVGTTRTEPGQVPAGPVPIYIVSAFVGFGQQYVWEFFDSLLRAIFRNPQAGGMNPPRPPA